mmetsp:Transcript_8365/g.24079  ORF Transcript_8365/g.24079 Transcript_8365/m.24079 type:complete len:268 (-) Transcript_8365:63-866(-)
MTRSILSFVVADVRKSLRLDLAVVFSFLKCCSVVEVVAAAAAAAESLPHHSIIGKLNISSAPRLALLVFDPPDDDADEDNEADDLDDCSMVGPLLTFVHEDPRSDGGAAAAADGNDNAGEATAQAAAYGARCPFPSSTSIMRGIGGMMVVVNEDGKAVADASIWYVRDARCCCCFCLRRSWRCLRRCCLVFFINKDRWLSARKGLGSRGSDVGAMLLVVVVVAMVDSSNLLRASVAGCGRERFIPARNNCCRSSCSMMCSGSCSYCC